MVMLTLRLGGVIVVIIFRFGWLCPPLRRQIVHPEISILTDAFCALGMIGGLVTWLPGWSDQSSKPVAVSSFAKSVLCRSTRHLTLPNTDNLQVFNVACVSINTRSLM